MIYHPIHTISLGSLFINIWGLMFALAIGLSLFWAYYRTPIKLRDHILNLGIIIILAGVIGSRLAFIILYPSGFSQIADIFKVWNGGMVSYGGFILSVFLTLAYLKRQKLSISQFGDILALPLALAIMITRIGCFLNHCHLGKLTEMPWGLKYLNEIRHPIALYYALSALIILLILVCLEKKLKPKQGVLVLVLATLYPLGRLIADQFAIYSQSWLTILNFSFLIALFLLFLYLLIRHLRTK